MNGGHYANPYLRFETQVSWGSKEQVSANILNGCFSIFGYIRDVPSSLREGTGLFPNYFFIMCNNKNWRLERNSIQAMPKVPLPLCGTGVLHSIP